jgi:hypothetical protein
MSELQVFKKRRGRPPGPNYPQNKLKTDRKNARRKEREEAGILIPEAKRKRLPFVPGKLDSELSLAANQLIRRADDIAQKHNADITVLVMPHSHEELPRVYSSNGELMQNFMNFEMVRSQLTPDNSLALTAPYHAFLLYHMQPIDPLPLRRNTEPFLLALPDEYADCEPLPLDSFPTVEPLEPGAELLARVEAPPPVAEVEATMTIETIIQRTQVTLKGKVPILDL